MQKSILSLEKYDNYTGVDKYRTIFKTQHGRVVYLELQIIDAFCTITDCCYIDRNQGRTGEARYNARPKKLQTLQFPLENLLPIIATELDKQFFGVEFAAGNQIELSKEAYIDVCWQKEKRKYHFLIMVGEGESYNGLPVRLRTRLKNKLHRSLYVELEHYKDGTGVVKKCCYYDRQYKRQDIEVTASMLISCFFPYTQEGILNLLNHEICCNFTHMIVTEGIDIDSNTMPLCGAV